jgi:hypothetical protein
LTPLVGGTGLPTTPLVGGTGLPTTQPPEPGD